MSLLDFGLFQALFTVFIMYYEATACNVEDDIAEVLQIFSNVLNCCLKFRDRQGSCFIFMLCFYPFSL